MHQLSCDWIIQKACTMMVFDNLGGRVGSRGTEEGNCNVALFMPGLFFIVMQIQIGKKCSAQPLLFHIE